MNKSVKEIIDHNRILIEQIKEKNEVIFRYREALEFYAEDDNYGYEVSYRPQPQIDCMALDDRGYTARKALEEPK